MKGSAATAFVQYKEKMVNNTLMTSCTGSPVAFCTCIFVKLLSYYKVLSYYKKEKLTQSLQSAQ